MACLFERTGVNRQEYPLLEFGNDSATSLPLLPRFIPHLSVAGEDIVGRYCFHFHAATRALPFLLRPLLSSLFCRNTIGSSDLGKSKGVIRRW